MLMPIETMSITVSDTAPNSGIFCDSEPGSWLVPPPMKYWNV